MKELDQTKLTVPEGQGLSIANIKPNYNITFHKPGKDGWSNGDVIGGLDFNGPALKFEGNAEESAKVFIDWIATAFKGRLDEEYKRGFEDGKKERN